MVSLCCALLTVRSYYWHEMLLLSALWQTTMLTWCMYRSCRRVDAFESFPFERSEDRGSLVNHQSSTPSVIASCWFDLVTSTAVVRNLGIFIDADVTMRSRVSRTVSSCFAILRQLRCIRRSVSRSCEPFFSHWCRHLSSVGWTIW